MLATRPWWSMPTKPCMGRRYCSMYAQQPSPPPPRNQRPQFMHDNCILSISTRAYFTTVFFSFRVETDEDSGEIILKGMGELHLDIKLDTLKRTYGVELDVDQPLLAYREAIFSAIEDSYTHMMQSGGYGQFGRIDYKILPGEPGGSGFISSLQVLWTVTYRKSFPRY